MEYNNITLQMNIENIILNEKKPVMQDHILYDSINMNVQNRQIYRDRKQISGFLGLRWGGGMTKCSEIDCGAGYTTL